MTRWMPPWTTLAVTTAVVLALVGCAADTPGAESESPSDRQSPGTTDGGGETASPSLPGRSEVQAPSPRPTGGSGGETITGEFGADSIEGGCAYLEADDGTRYEVLYPDGWEVQASPLQLTDPSGAVVASGGETITVRGTVADDMASICQIGPIFQADEVESID